MTRFELAKMLAAALKLPLDDESFDHWADRYVAAVTKAGLMTGTDRGFDGNAVVTRAQIAAIVARLFEAFPHGDVSVFLDAGDIPAWAADGFAIAVGARIFEVDPGTTLRPNAPVTRGEMAKILVRIMELSKEGALSLKSWCWHQANLDA